MGKVAKKVFCNETVTVDEMVKIVGKCRKTILRLRKENGFDTKEDFDKHYMVSKCGIKPKIQITDANTGRVYTHLEAAEYIDRDRATVRSWINKYGCNTLQALKEIDGRRKRRPRKRRTCKPASVLTHKQEVAINKTPLPVRVPKLGEEGYRFNRTEHCVREHTECFYYRECQDCRTDNKKNSDRYRLDGSCFRNKEHKFYWGGDRTRNANCGDGTCNHSG